VASNKALAGEQGKHSTALRTLRERSEEVGLESCVFKNVVGRGREGTGCFHSALICVHICFHC
jgi:hypothetical protein